MNNGFGLLKDDDIQKNPKSFEKSSENEFKMNVLEQYGECEVDKYLEQHHFTIVHEDRLKHYGHMNNSSTRDHFFFNSKILYNKPKLFLIGFKCISEDHISPRSIFHCLLYR